MMTDARSRIWDAIAAVAVEDTQLFALHQLSPFAFMRMVDAVAAIWPEPANEAADLNSWREGFDEGEKFGREEARWDWAVTDLPPDYLDMLMRNNAHVVKKLDRMLGRDDDYTPEAVDRTVEAEVVEHMEAAAEGLRALADEAAAAPKPDDEGWDPAFVRQALANAGVTAYRMAKVLGITSGQISNLLNGKSRSAHAQAKIMEFARSLSSAPEPHPAPEPETQPTAAAGPEPAPAPAAPPEPKPAAEVADYEQLRRAVVAKLNGSGQTRKAIAEAIGVHPTQVTHAVNPARRMPSMLSRLADHFGIEHDAEGVTTPVEDVDLAKTVRRFVADRTEPGTDEEYVSGPALRDEYEAWRQVHGAHALDAQTFGKTLTKVTGWRRKQASSPQARELGTGDARPMLYFGVRLRHADTEAPAPDTSAPPVTETAAQRHAREAEELRRLARQAREARGPVVIDKDAEAERSPNNGWLKPPAKADEVHVPELTRKDIEAEHAAIMSAPVKRGPTVVRPGREAMGQEQRDLINGLLDLGLAGWRYSPPQSGQLKPQLYAPDGSRFVLASTPGNAGFGKTNRELRRYLRRKGMLPTAEAPVSQLAKPGTYSRPAKQAEAVAEARAEMAVVEADPDAPPLAAEDLERDLFDLYEDVKAGLPGSYPFSYHPDVLALYGLNKEEVETAVRLPQRVEVRPESKVKGYPILKFQRGDVQAIVGFRNRSQPAVIACYWSSLLGHDDNKHANVHGGGGAKASTGVPTNPKSLMRRLRDMGAEIEQGHDEDTALVVYQGQELGRISTSQRTPKATVATDWQRTQRKINAIAQRELVKA